MPSPTGKFDPASIPPYSVVLAPVLFPGEVAEERKLLITFRHQAGSVECIKPTSNTAPFKANGRRAKGCVFYPAGDLAVFPKDTFIDPESRFTVPYSKLTDPHCVRARLPRDFRDKLIYAINASFLLSVYDKMDLLAIIEANGR